LKVREKTAMRAAALQAVPEGIAVNFAELADFPRAHGAADAG
jgi:hypothetical protein